MNAQQLKNSILQYAMQGKLVPQDPNDEPAAELVEQIRKEKEQLIQKKVIKKDKPLPPISDKEIPFDIPENWKWIRLSEIFRIINGDRGKNYPSKDKLTTEGIPFISAANIEKGTISKEKLLYMNQEQYDKLSGGKLIEGDMVLCIRGSLGKSGRFPFKMGAIASSLVILRSYIDENILYEYLNVYLGSNIFNSEIRLYNNGTAQPNLSAKDLSKFRIPLPPLDEQIRIVNKVNELFGVVHKYELNNIEINNLQNLFPAKLENSILHYAMQGKLVEQDSNEEPAAILIKQIREEKKRLIEEKLIKKETALSPITDEEIPFDIPDKWEWVRLGDLVTNNTGVSYKKDNLSIKTESMIRILRGGNIQSLKYLFKPDDIFIDSGFVKKGLILRKNTLITPAVTSLENIGKLARIDTDYENVAVGGFVLMLNPIVNNEILSKYLAYVLNSGFHRNACRNITKKSGQAFYNLSRTKMMELLVPLPPLKEQKRIVKRIDESIRISEKLK